MLYSRIDSPYILIFNKTFVTISILWLEKLLLPIWYICLKLQSRSLKVLIKMKMKRINNYLMKKNKTISVDILFKSSS